MKTIQLQTEWNTVFEYYRDEDGVKQCAETQFNNYFYCLAINMVEIEDLLEETKTNNGNKVEYDMTNDGKKSIYNEQLIKIMPSPYHYWACRRSIKEAGLKTYEANLDLILKYIVQNKTQFTDKRRVSVIDIETDMSLDVENAPKPITSITLYDYVTNVYHVWCLNNEVKEKVTYSRDDVQLYVYYDEREMMIHFVDKFKELDSDICFGWNSNNYDFPYILNRLKRLNLDPNSMSKFNKIEVRNYWKDGRQYWQPEIYGIELLDGIPVLKKNTCYSPQPANWKLSSVADFYLDIDKLVDIGAEAWKTNINDFLKYNVRDVELVKEIIDKFALIEFLMVIQTDLAPVPLNSSTHNSVVLLYYLKTHYPNIIIPDNNGTIMLEDDLINLKQSYVKIKAAHVIPPTPGIHHNVSIFDFAGLYPSIFRTFNICPSTIGDKGVEIDDIMMWNMVNTGRASSEIVKEYSFACKFSQDKKGIYPEVLEDLTTKRKIYKSQLGSLKEKHGADSKEYLLTLYRSDVLKQVSNSLFGVGGFNKFCMFDPKVSAAVTSISRKGLKFTEQLINNMGYQVLYGDTDACVVCHPVDVDPEELGLELNKKLKDWVLNSFPGLNKDNFCMELEYEKTFRTFVMKDAKKKYYGILNDGEFYCKGFDIIQHSLSKKIKDGLKKIYLDLMSNPGKIQLAKENIKAYRKEFFKYSDLDLGVELKVAKPIDEYVNATQHIRAARYSNKHFGTEFDAGSVGKLLFIKNVFGKKYPKTDVIFITDELKLPDDFLIDYEKHWEKFVLDKIKLLDDVEEMRIAAILSPNLSLDQFL